MGDIEKILDDAIKHAGGKFEITVKGMDAHILGDSNKSGVMMAAYGMVHTFAQYSGGFDKAIKILTGLNEVIDSEITETKRKDCAD